MAPARGRSVPDPIAGSLRPVSRRRPMCYGRRRQDGRQVSREEITPCRNPRRSSIVVIFCAARWPWRSGCRWVAQGEAGGFTLAASIQEEADAFLARFVAGWLPLQTAAEEANWAASTDVSEAHTDAQVARNLELNRYVGDPEVIDIVRRLLDHKDELNDLTVRQLEKVRLRAAERRGPFPRSSRPAPLPRRNSRPRRTGSPSTSAMGIATPPLPPTTSTASWSSRATSTSAAPRGRRPRRSDGRSARGSSGSASCATRSPAPWGSTTSSRSRSPTTA